MNRAVREKLNNIKFHEALAAIWSAISFGDRYVNDKKVWEIKNDTERAQALFNLVSLLDAVAFALEPFLPVTARKITEAVGREANEFKTKKIDILFPRLK
jgi:methionyl-tRNA synthetase